MPSASPWRGSKKSSQFAQPLSSPSKPVLGGEFFGWPKAELGRIAESPRRRTTKNPLDGKREGLRTGWRSLCRAHNVAGLEAFRPFQQVKLDGLAFIQRSVSVLLDGGEMYEDILARGALDESITLRPVEPLHSTLLSHKNSFRFDAKLFFRLFSVCPDSQAEKYSRRNTRLPLKKT